MKNLILSALLLLSLNISAQTEVIVPQKLEFDEFVSLSGINKSAIYEAAKIFFIKEYNNGIAPLKMNKNKGRIIGSTKNTFRLRAGKLNKSYATILSYQITMYIGDDGYLIGLSNFHFITETKRIVSGSVYYEGSPNNDKQKKLEALLIPLAKQSSEKIQRDVHAFLLKYTRNSIVQNEE